MVLDMAFVHVKEGPSNYVLHQAERYGNEAVNHNVTRLRHACNRVYSGNKCILELGAESSTVLKENEYLT
jgi:hypothetical protein